MQEIRLPHHEGIFKNHFVPKFVIDHIGEYCRNREQTIQCGRVDAKYIYVNAIKEQTRLDLNPGFETWEQKSGIDEKLEALLEWIMKQCPAGSNLKKVIHDAEFVCWRGLLTKFAFTPVTHGSEPWKAVAIRKKGVIFICERETDEAKERKRKETDRDRRLCYYGHKFEQYLTSRNGIHDAPDTSEAVSCKEEFVTVCRSTVRHRNRQKIKILYAGEVDCLSEDGELIELKTQKGEMNYQYQKKKLTKWWLQSFLVDCKKLIVGHRDDKGFVFSVRPMYFDDLARNVRPPVEQCLNFLTHVLAAISTVIENDGEACTIECNSTLDDVVLVKKTNSSEVIDILSHPFRVHFEIE